MLSCIRPTDTAGTESPRRELSFQEANDSPEVIARKTETIPLKRYGQPEDMGHAISYLASPQAGFVTGQVISPNGGFQMT